MIEDRRGARGERGERTRVSITPLGCDDVGALAALAAEIWRQHYPGIISAAQIEYMLVQRYAPALVREQLSAGVIRWDQLRVGDRLIGFVSYFAGERAGEMKLDKLYVHHDHQRRGYGRMLLGRVIAIARSYGHWRIALAVNKKNSGALTAYRKYGFAVAESMVVDIGGGFVMDDYLMALEI